MTQILIQVKDLRTWFPKNRTMLGKARAWLKAVDDATLTEENQVETSSNAHGWTSEVLVGGGE